MSDDAARRLQQLSPVKQALLAVEQMQARLNAVERERHEPIAIVGLSCRFPGGETPADYWRLLREGRDAVREVPKERWDAEAWYDPDPDAPGKLYARHGGFLASVDGFDAAFFHVSPREAVSLDPQQRLLLEVAWEALEDAGLPRARLRGSRTGVFVGATTNDYAQLLREAGLVDAHFFTGNPLNALAGRLSYSLGLHGPALVIDTACSSALVAVHQACQALRAGECETALAGAVNLLLSPHTHLAVCRTRALAADGRCKTFDAAADGFVRGEGCGVVVLKPLSAAERDGDRVQAVILGSAVNQDGASSGFTAPNGQAQRALLRQALGAHAPASVDYVEAHGTGTALGDPVELEALGDVFGSEPAREAPLLVGSAKANVGHLEAAAGMAGLVKLVLALEHGELPGQVHFHVPNPHVRWDALPLRVCRQLTPWPRGARRRLAGVSAFGASGTNAHLLLGEPGQPAATAAAPEEAPRGAHALLLSARTPAALDALARRYREALEALPEPELPAFCAAAASGRTHFEERLAVVGATREELRAQLSEFALGRPGRARRATLARAARPRLAWLFTGQGAQHVGMGRGLYRSQPRFRRTLDACDALLRAEFDLPLLDVLFAPESPEARARLDATLCAQPALFALGAALVDLLRACGPAPVAVLGHSVGEYTAAYAAGVFGLEDGLRLVTRRARLMQAVPGDGTMAALLAPEEVVRAALSGHDGVELAALNGPRHCVVSGPRVSVEALLAELAAQGIEARPLNVSHAFHSPQVEPMLAEFEQAARSVAAQAPRLTLVGNLDGRPLAGAPDASYWRRHCRAPVRFADGIETLLAQGCDHFLELGPRPVLGLLGRACAGERAAAWLPTLRPGRDDWSVLLDSLAALHTQGLEIDWAALDASRPRPRVRLPTYPFERRRYWPDSSPASSQGANVMGTSPGTPPAPEAARRAQVLDVLRAALAAALHTDPSRVDPSTPLLDLGADSLVLVDAVRQIETTYGLKLSMRRFFEDLDTLDALADYVAGELPAEAPQAPAASAPAAATAPSVVLAAPVVPVPVAVPSGETSAPGSLHALALEQGRLLADFLGRQLETLRAGAPVVPAAAAAPAPVAAAAPVPRAPVRLPERRDAPPPPWGNAAELRARGLDARQRAHLEALIERYTQRTRRSRELAAAARPALADSRAAVGFRFSTKEMLYPLTAARTDGARMWDADGNEYVDFTMGFGVHLFGHRPDFVQQAIAEEQERGIELGARSPLVGEVAELLTRLTGHQRVAFANSGTEAVMAALRLARAASGRDLVVLFTHAYHGHSDGTLVVDEGGAEPRSLPAAPGVPQGLADQVLVLEYGSPRALEIIRARSGELAAVMVEPIQSRQPMLQPREFLHELRRLADAGGWALIFDEMISGFRLHPRGAQGYFDVQADLATYGKIVGGGLPIGVVAGRASFMDGIDGGQWNYGDGSFPAHPRTAFGGTFCQHPLAMAAARAVLRRLVEAGPELQAGLNRRTAELAARLDAWFEREALPIHVGHFGSLFRLESSLNLELLYYHLLERGLYIWEWRSCFLATAHTEDDVDLLVRSIQAGAAELREGGFLPPPSGTPPAGGAGRAPERAAATEGEREPAVAAQADDEAPALSAAQRQLFVLAALDPAGSLAYTSSTTLRLRGELDRPRLLTALDALVARHEALRTRIDPDGARQRAAPAARLDVPVFDLRDLPPEERAERAAAQLRALSRRPLDLCAGPLFEAALLAEGEREHLLYLRAHHVVADGWSFGVLLRDLAALYSEPRASPPPAPPFSRFLAWQRARLAGPEMAAHADFWRAACADPPPALELPGARARGAARSFQGERTTLALGAELTRDLVALGRRQGATPFMLLLAAYTLWLHRLTGQHDLMVGVPVGGRGLPGGDDLVGYCTHLLPVRSRYDPRAGFVDHLKRLRSTLLDAYEHQDYPFAQLVEALELPRPDHGTPLLSTVFNLEPLPALPRFAGLEAVQEETTLTHTPFDLSLNLVETPAGLLIDAHHACDVFEPGAAARLLGHYVTLLEGVRRDPARRVSELPLVTPGEREHVLVGFGRGPALATAPGTLHGLVFERARASPQATAVLAHTAAGERTLTYAELIARAEALAGRLAAAGVGPESRVAVFLERTPEAVAALLGVLAAGGAYVPLDPAYPQPRLAATLESASVAALVTTSALLARLPPLDAPRVLLDAPDGAAGRPARAPLPENLAYVLFTSGSTGRPKGVALTHRGALELVRWAQSLYDERELAFVLASTSFSFDLSVFELFVPLASGGTLVLAEQALEAPALGPGSRVTLVNSVPSVMAEVLRAGLPDSVRTVNLAGEPLPLALVERLYAGGKVTRVFNLYGPTEDTTYSTGALVPPGATAAPSIGRSLANRHAYVLDARLEPVPVGVTGELYLGGAGLARGYLGDPALTAARFVPDPFSAQPGARVYRSGDLARWRPEGELHFLGRADDQAKIRGVRVEPGEVTAALARHADVRECVVVAGSDEAGARRLVAYVASPRQDERLADDLRVFLGARLPRPMLPAAFVRLEALPRLPNGKLDRARLPAPRPSQAYVAPEGPLEAGLAAVFEDVLGRRPVGALDSFFDLGGHSLTAMQVAAEVRRRLRRELSLADVFQHPSVRELAHALGPAGVGDAPIARRPPAESDRLAPAQRQIWLQEQLLGTAGGNTRPLVLRLDGALDAEALRRSFELLCERHEVLRTLFVAREGEPRAQVRERLAPGFRQVDLASAADPEAALEELRREEARTPLSLEHGPLLRVVLARLHDQRHACIVSLHHVAGDGWSARVLRRELLQVYDALVEGRDPDLAPLPLQYRDYAGWLEELLLGPAADELRAYWHEALRPPLAALELPLDFPRDPSQPYQARELRATLDPGPLENLAREHGATLFMGLAASVLALLHRLSGQVDVRLGTPVAGRVRRELEGQVGPYFNTLVLRERLDPDLRFADLLVSVRRTTLRAFRHQLYPLGLLVSELHASRGGGRAPLFDVGLTLQSQADLLALTPSRHVQVRDEDRPLDDAHTEARTDLWFLAERREASLALTVVYNARLFRPETIQAQVVGLGSLWRQVVQDPGLPLGQITLGDGPRRPRGRKVSIELGL